MPTPTILRLVLTKVRRLLGHSAPKLSEILLRPAWPEHPLSSRFGNERAWYVLFIPTLSEGHEVGAQVRRVLASVQADVTVVLAYFAGDPTEQDILREAARSPEIATMRVEAPAGDFAAMERLFHSKLQTLIEERGRPPQDVITVTVPALESRRKRLRL